MHQYLHPDILMRLVSPEHPRHLAPNDEEGKNLSLMLA